MSLASNSLVNKPSFIEYENLRFLIMDAPKDTNLHIYLRECKKYNVTHIVRISEPSYSKEEVEAAGIGLHVRIYPSLFILLILNVFHFLGSFFKLGNVLS
jgi:hypothetical protein